MAPASRRCIGTTLDGDRCPNYVVPPKMYCHIHDDQVVVIRVRRRAKGGKKGAKKR
jgi:hypothetical protein